MTCSGIESPPNRRTPHPYKIKYEYSSIPRTGQIFGNQPLVWLSNIHLDFWTLIQDAYVKSPPSIAVLNKELLVSGKDLGKPFAQINALLKHISLSSSRSLIPQHFRRIITGGLPSI